jgi:hypothetical protein
VSYWFVGCRYLWQQVPSEKARDTRLHLCIARISWSMSRSGNQRSTTQQPSIFHIYFLLIPSHLLLVPLWETGLLPQLLAVARGPWEGCNESWAQENCSRDAEFVANLHEVNITKTSPWNQEFNRRTTRDESLFQLKQDHLELEKRKWRRRRCA